MHGSETCVCASLKADPVLEVVCALIRKNGKVLAVQRSEAQDLSGYWEFPGGKVEAGETEEEALVREIREELRMDIRPLQRLQPHNWQDPDKPRVIRLIPYLCDTDDAEPTLVEHAGFRWLDKEELATMDWAPADVAVVEQVG